jgi:hypothetical protein
VTEYTWRYDTKIDYEFSVVIRTRYVLSAKKLLEIQKNFGRIIQLIETFDMSDTIMEVTK